MEPFTSSRSMPFLTIRFHSLFHANIQVSVSCTICVIGNVLLRLWEPTLKNVNRILKGPLGLAVDKTCIDALVRSIFTFTNYFIIKLCKIREHQTVLCSGGVCWCGNANRCRGTNRRQNLESFFGMGVSCFGCLWITERFLSYHQPTQSNCIPKILSPNHRGRPTHTRTLFPLLWLSTVV